MSKGYNHHSLWQLKEQQVRYAPRDRRLEQAAQAEKLLSEISPEKEYPYDYLVYRITGYRSATTNHPNIKGEDVQHDLPRFVEDLTATVGQKIEQAGEPVFTVQDLSGQYSVTQRTVNRWRREGLVARSFLVDGRKKVGFLKSSVDRFINTHHDRVERSARFRHLTEEEREEIIRRARRMIQAQGNSLMTDIAKRIARKLGRSHETIRTTIKDYDRENPERALFPDKPPPLTHDQKNKIYQAMRQGVDVGLLCKEYKRERSTIYRVIYEVRASRLLENRLEYISHPSFDDPETEAVALAPMPEPVNGKPGRKPKAPKGLPPYLASLYEVPLLSREQEMHLFRRMNYLKHKATRLREALEPSRAKPSDMDEIDRLQEEALAVKNQIIRANLRLVVSIAKRHVGPTNNFFELVSDGNMSLIRAVEKFDYSRGNKFSTYASWAIMKNFARTIPEENYRRDRFVTGHEEMFDAAADTRADEHEYESAHKRMQEAIRGMLDRLDDRERLIIKSRFGLGGSTERTLEQLGRELGITKERVRQLQTRGVDKLRKIAGEQKLDLPMF